MADESAHDVVTIIDSLSVRTKMVIDHQPPAIQRRIREYILTEAEARRVNGVISLAWPALLTVVQKPRLERGNPMSNLEPNTLCLIALKKCWRPKH